MRCIDFVLDFLNSRNTGWIRDCLALVHVVIYQGQSLDSAQREIIVE